jgi:hypothetical protein
MNAYIAGGSNEPISDSNCSVTKKRSRKKQVDVSAAFPRNLIFERYFSDTFQLVSKFLLHAAIINYWKSNKYFWLETLSNYTSIPEFARGVRAHAACRTGLW